MTGERDTERLLAAFLTEGPEWAPAAAVDAALDHARRHPRRHGPGAWLSRVSGVGVRPIAGRRVAWVPILVVVALGLAIVAAALIGMQRPDRPPMNGLLVLSAAGDLWTVDPAVGNPTKITATQDVEERTARWSPDGSRLAVFATGWPSGTSRIDVMDAAGGERRPVTPDLEGLEPDLAWFPDGKRLVFTVGARLMTVDADAGPGSIGVVTDQPGQTPVVAPDGRRIAFVGYTQHSGVYVVDAGGGEARRVVTFEDLGYPDLSGPAPAIAPAWSRDGGSLIVHATGTNAERARSYRVDPANGQARLLAEWSPRPEESVVGPDGRLATLTDGTIAIVDPADSAAPILTATIGASGPEARLGWSPDGRLVAVANPVACGEPLCSVRLWLARTDGPALRPTVVSVWLPDQGVARGLWGSIVTGVLDWQALPYPSGIEPYTAGETCTTVAGGTEVTDGDLTYWHDVIVECRDRADDPRRSGTRRLVADYRISPDDSATIAGATELTTPDGSWEGSFSGTIAAGFGRHEVSAVETGTGAYAGLAAEFRVVGDGATFEVEGTFGPVD